MLKSVIKRWNDSYKKRIYESRILTTRNLVEALPIGKEMVFCSTSAIGYYGNGVENILNENSPNGSDLIRSRFLGSGKNKISNLYNNLK